MFLNRRHARRLQWFHKTAEEVAEKLGVGCGRCGCSSGEHGQRHLLAFACGRHGNQKVSLKRGITGLTLVLLCFTATFYYRTTASSAGLDQSDRYNSRRLLSTNTSTTSYPTISHGASWETCDFEKANIPSAWLVVHFFAISIIFIALALICDDFFVPSLEVISEKLNLSEDVAGATFMAAGSSAPELFTSVAGVAAQTDVGVGTIVGSALFNLLIIIALTAVLAGQVLNLDWRPIIRDSFFYALSLCAFIIFAWDGFIQHYEAAILLVLYTCYIMLMVFNPKLMAWMTTWRVSSCSKSSVLPTSSQESETEVNAGVNAQGSASLAHNGNTPATGFSRVGEKTGDSRLQINTQIPLDSQVGQVDKQSSRHSIEGDSDSDEGDIYQLCPCLPCCPVIRGANPPTAENARKRESCIEWTKYVLRWILFIPSFPFLVLFSWTVPDCSKEHNRQWFIVSFLASVTWIALLSFAMVTIAGRAGCILDIDHYIMGLCIIAIGTSIPDAISSILVARDGYGDMAVSNAIGSNVFDINLGIGLPFIIRIIIDKGVPIALLDAKELEEYHNGTMMIVPHVKFGFILLVILILALFMFILSGFKLTKNIAIGFVIVYFLFMAYAFIQEIYCIRKLGTYC